jgi:hypothetical protein
MPTTNIIEYRKNDDKNIVEDKLPINEEKKKNMFRGTIAISLVYGGFALLLLFATAFNNTMRDILFNKFMPFTLIFIIGTILIIILMLYFIFSYVPVNVPKIDKDDYISCPDYWKVEIIDDNVINKAFDPNYPKNLFKYKCVMDDAIYNKKQLYIDNITSGIGLRYTNIFSNITSNSTGDTSNGMYNSGKSTGFNTDYNMYSNVGNIYKNLNYFNPSSSAGGKNKINEYINTNSTSIARNVFSNLEEITYLQNNYKFTDDNKTSLTDIIKSSNVYSKSPTHLSPIAWQFNDGATNDATYGITIRPSTNSSNDLAKVDSMILNWNNLTPEIAFNKGVSIASDPMDNDNEKIRHIYVYYNYASGSNIYLGDIIITSNAKNEPKYDMIYKTEGKIFAKHQDYTLNNIIPIGKIDFGDIKGVDNNLHASSYYRSLINFNSNEKPIIQLYHIDNQRPTTIDRNNAKTFRSNIPLLCDEIYPSLFASFDNADNNVRCAYSKICGIPWSDLRCSDQIQ